MLHKELRPLTHSRDSVAFLRLMYIRVTLGLYLTPYCRALMARDTWLFNPRPHAPQGLRPLTHSRDSVAFLRLMYIRVTLGLYLTPYCRALMARDAWLFNPRLHAPYLVAGASPHDRPRENKTPSFRRGGP